MTRVDPFESSPPRAGAAGSGELDAWPCSKIDNSCSLCDESRNTVLFIAAGIAPALIGGLLYGWALYGQDRPFTTEKMEYFT